MTIDLDELERIGKAAIPDWSGCSVVDCTCGNLFGDAGEVYVGHFYGPKDVHQTDPVPSTHELQKANCDFSIAARNNWQEMIDEIRCLRGKADDFLEVNNPMKDLHRILELEKEVTRLRNVREMLAREFETGRFCRMADHSQGMCDCEVIGRFIRTHLSG